MKTAAITLILSLFLYQAQGQTMSKSELTLVFKNAEQYLVGVAQRMPEEHFDFQPTEEVRNFGAQLNHVTSNIYRLTSKYFLNQDTPDFKLENSKPAQIKAFQEAMEYLLKNIQNSSENELHSTTTFFTGEKMPKWKLLLVIRDHMTHHRGQMILYLRLKGIAPPNYVGW